MHNERFSYVRAGSAAEALQLLNEPGIISRALAGGTDLVLQARHEQPSFDRVVDISNTPDLRRIERQGDDVQIGSAVSFAEVIESAVISETAPVLVSACRQVGAVQIRNMGTLGGNVANAAACADTLPALVCLDATAMVIIPGDSFEVTVSELVIAPNRTRIPGGGLLTGFRYRIPHSGSRSVFLKLGRRNAMAISRLTVAALGRLDAFGRIAEARLAPGSAAPQIVRFTPVEAALVGQAPSAELFKVAGEIAVEEMARLSGRRWSSEYKEPALAALVARACAQVFDPTP